MEWRGEDQFSQGYLFQKYTSKSRVDNTLITYSMEYSHSWEANSFSANQEIPHIS